MMRYPNVILLIAGERGQCRMHLTASAQAFADTATK